MRIGVDFDNTIVCYDRIFDLVALEQGLIPAELPINKDQVRNHLRRNGQEEAWIELQGTVYGPRMLEADPFPGVLEFFARAQAAGHEVRVISHRTLHPFRGPKHDLHKAARQWLESRGHLGMEPRHIHFELTKREKLARIAAEGCTHFIDDLPEFLGEAEFPAGVARLLFDPSGNHASNGSFRRAASWGELEELLLTRGPEVPREAVAALLASAGHAGDFALRSLPGAANNQVYRVDLAGASLVLKAYFHHPQDGRDRLGAEFAFSRFAWDHGVRALPKPLASDPKNRLGLYEFVPGRRPAPGQIGEEAVRQALDFCRDLNRHKDKPEAGALGAASEACFSLAEHVRCVERRLAGFKAVPKSSAESAEAWEFIHGELAESWRETLSSVKRQARESGLAWDEPIPAAERCLSPSDFGFHNALVDAKGRLRFIDFEYAGWDDPAKLICDFFCEPAVPVPPDHFDLFARGIVAGSRESERHLRRVALLFPVHRVKWCCILLNDFLPVGGARRGFARHAGSRAEQLDKARRLLRNFSKR